MSRYVTDQDGEWDRKHGGLVRRGPDTMANRRRREARERLVRQEIEFNKPRRHRVRSGRHGEELRVLGPRGAAGEPKFYPYSSLF